MTDETGSSVDPAELLIPDGEGSGLLDQATPPVPGQETMFGSDEDFHKHWREWKGMPPFEANDEGARFQVIVSFRNGADRDEFYKLVSSLPKMVGQTLTPFTPSFWYPKAEVDEVNDLRWRSEQRKGPGFVAGTTKQKRAAAAKRATKKGLGL